MRDLRERVGRLWLVVLTGLVVCLAFGSFGSVYAEEEERETEASEVREREPKRTREREREVEWVSEDAFHFYREAQELRERGRAEAAEELMERAERIEREARRRRERRREREREEPRFISDEAFELSQKARWMAREGRREDAAELYERAERVEAEARERRERAERRERREREERERPGVDERDLHADIAELRHDLRRLQDQVEELTALVRRLLEQR